MTAALWQHLDKLESYICRILLAVFVTLLFVQIVARQVFGFSITWIEEFSVILFVWFAYFGASYAARMAAHNRVTFHIRMMPRQLGRMVEAVGDLFWVMFNVIFIFYAIRYIGALKPFVKAQTLGWPMKWLMAPMVVAFVLMTLRILQVNYLKLVLGVDPRDPDEVEIELAQQELPERGKF
ncbi:TRAP transporter small permease [Paracoccus alkenifer]|uniref:TRAP transporter small permease protein n=1 Tax=Paracoccus alkenifer TaxID=65735 RepID=A0A1H6KS86_9RHOB|nr:TRAP transporter small permease [Paracoccus alkenifer]SEH78691.1 TRAP-type C4-dicarboxylate transport system, small permease component [Paracoccus alkenifer]